MAIKQDEWNKGEKSELVSIGSHRLFLSVCGPERHNGEPIIIIMTGVTSTITGWAAVRKALAATCRVLMYDRAGLGRSENSPNFPSSINIAKELDELLKVTRIEPPYLTIGHSWGGILTQEFLALDSSRIIGMIFVEATQARYPRLISFTDPAFAIMTKGLDWFEAIGLGGIAALSPEEYRIFLDEQKTQSHCAQSGLEFQALMESFETSEQKGFLQMNQPILGARPVCVVKGHNERDVGRAYEAGIRAGNGTIEERLRFNDILATWEERENELQREYLNLSSVGKFITAEDCGHSVHMVPSGIARIVEAVQWTLDHLVR